MHPKIPLLPSASRLLTSLLLLALLLLMLLAMSPTATAGDARPSPMSSLDHRITGLPEYIRTHPDQRWRREGHAALAEGRPDAALAHFMRSARYADKMAQALAAQMLWNGEGSDVDRAAGHAWMALAAERGYPLMVAVREQFWNELDDEERRRAQTLHATLLAEFGDAVAKPRMEQALRKAVRERTGSRLGSDVGELSGVQGYNDPKHWVPDRYWQWQDALLSQHLPPRVRRVALPEFRRSHTARDRRADVEVTAR